MSTFYIVSSEEINSITEDFAIALSEFLAYVADGDPVTLKYSP